MTKLSKALAAVGLALAAVLAGMLWEAWVTRDENCPHERLRQWCMTCREDYDPFKSKCVCSAGKTCGDVDGKGLICTRSIGHHGDHVGCFKKKHRLNVWQ